MSAQQVQGLHIDVGTETVCGVSAPCPEAAMFSQCLHGCLGIFELVKGREPNLPPEEKWPCGARQTLLRER